MAKEKAVKLDKVVAELNKVSVALKDAKKKAGREHKERFDLHIKYISDTKKELVAKCRGSFSLVSPSK